MERKRLLYRTVGRDFPKKIFFVIGFIGLPILFGLSAYFWLYLKHNNTKKRKLTASSSQRVKKGLPPGLINLGNTCFINCLLQAFSAVKHFCTWIEDFDDDDDKILLSSLKHILKVLNNKNGIDKDIFSASDVIESLNAHGWTGTMQQQDVHEFFQVISSTLEDELTTLTCDEHSLLVEDNYAKKLKGIVNRACREISATPSLPVSPFKGALANKMVCLSCGYQSVRFDPFETISLRIPRLSTLIASSLESCLAEFTKNELVDDVNCPCCTKLRGSLIPVKSRFSKQLTFAKLPKCLCFHIQRSHFLQNGSSFKNKQFVRFSELIDVAPFRYRTAPNKKSNESFLVDSHGNDEKLCTLLGGSNMFNLSQSGPKLVYSSSLYRLQSVIVHIGEVHRGHFITYRRAVRAGDDWVFSSDECIKLVSKQTVLSSNAYLLFYERADEHVLC